MRAVLMTSIVLKRNVTLMDVVSTRMLGQFGFLATIFGIFKDQKISVDVVATSEIAVSLTLDPRQALSPGYRPDDASDGVQELIHCTYYMCVLHMLNLLLSPCMQLDEALLRLIVYMINLL